MEFLPVNDAATPFGLMRFRLIFSGEMSADSRRSGNSRVTEKWNIREQIHLQIRELYQVHPALRAHQHVDVVRRLPPDQLTKPQKDYLEVLHEPVSVEGFKFIPLVRESLFLTCSLSITFLRRQESPLVKPRGDIDNRVKTLLDGLSMPKPGGGIVGSDPAKRPKDDPCYVLMEDDSQISGLAVHVDRYLGGPGLADNAALLLIDVDVRGTQLHWKEVAGQN
jgi:hypothetical protein